MIAVVNQPIDPNALLQKLDQKGAGSIVTHLGVVKPDPEGRKSSGLTLAADGDMEAELSGIEKDVRDAFKIIDLVLARRLGELSVGDVILFAAVSANDRKNAFSACRELIERCKKLSTLKKKEHYLE